MIFRGRMNFALKNELKKLGANIQVTESSLKLFEAKKIKNNIKIKTYDDHRMAMSFACLVIKTNIIINNPEVVSKSYKSFWLDLEKIGVIIE